MLRMREQAAKTASFYNTVGFNDVAKRACKL
jgi:glucuronate isomerase